MGTGAMGPSGAASALSLPWGLLLPGTAHLSPSPPFFHPRGFFNYFIKACIIK